jgi:RNA polymerase sigma-70 factor (ECF subfamily)
MADNASNPKSDSTGAAPFRTTHWSVVLAAGDIRSPQSGEALEKLCRTYWYPLYAFVRRRGYSPDDAQDLTQGFFARLLARQDLGHVDRQKGRFRSYLLAALQHFLADEWDKASAQKRGGEAPTLSLDGPAAEQSYQQEPADELNPEKIYDRRWALTVLERAQADLRAEFVAAGKGNIYEALKLFLSGEKPGQTHAQVAARLGKSPDAVRCAVQRLRQRYGELIRAEVAHTVSSPGQIDEEIRYLLTMIGSV